jgi:hypothetical protein
LTCICELPAGSPFCTIYSADDPTKQPLKYGKFTTSAAISVNSPANVCSVWCGKAPVNSLGDAEIQNQFASVTDKLCLSVEMR